MREGILFGIWRLCDFGEMELSAWGLFGRFCGCGGCFSFALSCERCSLGVLMIVGASAPPLPSRIVGEKVEGLDHCLWWFSCKERSDIKGMFIGGEYLALSQ